MGESGGGSPTGPRLHQVSLRTWRPKDDRRRCVEEAQDEGLRLQPGVRRQLLSADDPVHQPQGHLWTVLKEGRRLPSPQRRSHLCQAQPGPVPSRCSQNTDQGVEWDHSDGQSEPDEEHRDEQTATSYTPGQCQHSIQPHQTAEGCTSRPGGGQPLHQRALHRKGRKPQARHQVPQPPIGEGLCQPDPPSLDSILLIYNNMNSVIVIMTIITLMMTVMMTMMTSLIYCQ